LPLLRLFSYFRRHAAYFVICFRQIDAPALRLQMSFLDIYRERDTPFTSTAPAEMPIFTTVIDVEPPPPRHLRRIRRHIAAISPPAAPELRLKTFIATAEPPPPADTRQIRHADAAIRVAFRQRPRAIFDR
jgi:hypothetical protein